jgi:hypothetical protein
VREYDGVWVFNGDGGRFAGGIFTTQAAETWIYEWAIARGVFTPKQEKHSSPAFIGSFTTRFNAASPLRERHSRRLALRVHSGALA